MENIKENQQVLPNEEENFSLHGLLNQVDENNVQPEINQTVEQETTTTNDVIVNDEPVDKKDEALNHLNDYASMMKEKEEQVRIDYEKKVADERVQSALLEKQANAKNNFNDNIIEMDDDEEKEIENTTSKKRKRADVDLSSIVIKKSKKVSEDDVVSVFKKRIDSTENTTRVVAINSGYAANMGGFSSPALRKVSAEINQYDMGFGRADYRYRLLYSKLKGSSVGFMDYMTFLKTTSLLEVDILFYGIVCSTYPDKNEFPAKCPSCNHSFRYEYANADYLAGPEDGEEFDELTEKIRTLLKAQSVDTEEILANAPVNNLHRVILDESGIIIDLRHPTLYDHLYDVLEKIPEGENSPLVDSMPFIENVYIPDNEGAYSQITKVSNKLTVLENIDEFDDVQLAEEIKNIIDSNKIRFSVRDVSCPSCGNTYPEAPVSMEQMLFMIHQIRVMGK